MTEALRLIAFILLAIGILLVAFSVYIFITKDIRKIILELKSTKKVSADKITDNTLTNDIYYRSEAVTVHSKELKVQPKGFRRQQERPAKNDTGLLRTGVSESARKEQRRKMQQAAERPAQRPIERPAAVNPVTPERVAEQMAPSRKERTNTAPLQMSPEEMQPVQKKRESHGTNVLEVVDFDKKIAEKPAENTVSKPKKAGHTAPLQPVDNEYKAEPEIKETPLINVQEIVESKEPPKPQLEAVPIAQEVKRKETAPLQVEQERQNAAPLSTPTHGTAVLEESESFDKKPERLAGNDITRAAKKGQTAPLQPINNVENEVPVKLESTRKETAPLQEKPNRQDTAPLKQPAHGTAVLEEVECFDKNSERPAENDIVKARTNGQTAPLQPVIEEKGTAPLREEHHGTSVLEVDTEESESEKTPRKGRDTLPLQ